MTKADAVGGGRPRATAAKAAATVPNRPACRCDAWPEATSESIVALPCPLPTPHTAERTACGSNGVGSAAKDSKNSSMARARGKIFKARFSLRASEAAVAAAAMGASPEFVDKNGGDLTSDERRRVQQRIIRGGCGSDTG